MRTPGFGIVIKVQNLPLCKTFYRDVLNLGTPVMESNFWVEFLLENGFALMLAAVPPGTELPPESARFSWVLSSLEPEQLVERLAAFGYRPLETGEIMGYSVIGYRDPEGNPFNLMTPLENRQ